jgi:predicted TPR repeat methyltransferase
MTGMAAQLIAQEKTLDTNRILGNLRGDIKSSRSEDRDKAVRALSAWPTITPFDDLIALADEKLDEKQRAIVCQGIIRLIGSVHDRSPELITELTTKALKTTAPLDVKKTLLARLTSRPSLEAMQMGCGRGFWHQAVFCFSQ